MKKITAGIQCLNLPALQFSNKLNQVAEETRVVRAATRCKEPRKRKDSDPDVKYVFKTSGRTGGFLFVVLIRAY